MRLVSRQIDRATSDNETQAVRDHTLKCEKCRIKFNMITGADRLLAKSLNSQRLTEGFSGTVAERLAQAHLAESVRGIPRTLTGAALGLGVLVIVLLVLLLSGSGPQIPATGRVGRLEGGLELALFGRNSFRAASMGQEIPQGAMVQTRVGSGLIKLAGDRDVALGAETLLDLSHYHDGARILLKRGEVYILAPGADVQVDTPGAKVYGRGTSFLVRYESSGKTTTVVETGKVNLFNASGVVEISPGEKAELLEDEKPGNAVKANMENYLGWVRQLGL